MTSAAHGRTYPDAGVIATRPATAPEAAPTVVGRPCRTHSGIIHPNTAAAVASCVAVKALAASGPAVSALPALNPNQPNHSIDAPSTTNGTLCGTAGCGQPCLRPTTSAAASAATPALRCTTVPPAKSSAPTPSGPRNPPPHTQWASGAYTSTAHSPVKARYPGNRIRSANAPEISAGVMIANIIW